jgi:ParB family chromosome partitioning protein
MLEGTDAPSAVVLRGRRKTLYDRLVAIGQLQPTEQRVAAPPAPSRRAAGSTRPREQARAAQPGNRSRRVITSTGAKPMLSLSTVPLKHLRVSPLNVRKTNANEDIDALAEDIRQHGLKQNLVVVKHTLGKDTYEVVAGGRRLQALLKLADDHVITLDEQIPVLIEDRSEGRATSLSENLHRIAMNPADEFIAFASIVQDHQAEPDPILYCARRFGVSRRHVEERLRLAELAPEILDALRDGRIGIGAARAYGAFAEHTLQLQVFRAEEKRSYGTKHDPRNVRDALKTKTYPADCAQMLYVGRDAYLEAGGRLERELFLDQDEGERVTDPSLLDRLARAKADAEAEARGKLDGFSAGMLVQGFGPWPNWPKTPDSFTRRWGGVPDSGRDALIAVYKLKGDGSELALEGCFQPAPKSVAVPFNNAAAYAEERRLARIRTFAAQRALPSFDGTPLAGVAVLPDPDEDWAVEPVDENDTEATGDVYVLVRVLVKADQVEAHIAEAEAAIAAKDEAEKAQEATAAAAVEATVTA